MYNFLRKSFKWLSLGKSLPCSCAGGGLLRWQSSDATRGSYELVVATRVSTGRRAETPSVETGWAVHFMVHSWLLVQQWVCRLVCSADQINAWRRGGGSLGSDSRRLFPGQRALLQPAEAPVSGWVREQPLFFKTDSKCALVLNWGCLAMLGMIYSAVCMYTFQFIYIFLYIYGYYIGWLLYMVVIINCQSYCLY